MHEQLNKPRPEGTRIHLVLVDDHQMVREGLKMFLSVYADIEVSAEAADGAQAVALCAQAQPDVILMDIVMPNVDGPTATERIHAQFPSVQIIALTSFVDEALVQRALRAGAIGYLLKDIHADKLAEAIRDAHHGRSTIAAAAAQALLRATRSQPGPRQNLTSREQEVLRLLVAGMTNQEIADRLTLSLSTARLHVSNILAKLGVSNRTEAALLAVQHQWAA